MKNKTLILIPVLAAVLAVSGCAKKETPSPVVSNNTNARQVNANVNKENDTKDTAQGEIIKEENGWKRYVDKNLGIEFRFQDINDDTKVTTSGDWLCLEQISADDSYICMSKDVVLEYYREKYTNLEDYLKYYYGLDRYGTKTELIEIEKINNSNNLELLKAEMMLYIGLDQEDRGIGNDYYIEYKNEDFRYLSIGYSPSYDSLDKEIQYLQVINSLKFID